MVAHGVEFGPEGVGHLGLLYPYDIVADPDWAGWADHGDEDAAFHGMDDAGAFIVDGNEWFDRVFRYMAIADMVDVVGKRFAGSFDNVEGVFLVPSADHVGKDASGEMPDDWAFSSPLYGIRLLGVSERLGHTAFRILGGLSIRRWASLQLT